MFTFNWGKLGKSIQREALELSQHLFYNLGNLGLSLSVLKEKETNTRILCLKYETILEE